MKSVASSQSPNVAARRETGFLLVSAILLLAYVTLGRVWALPDLWVAIRGITLLWSPIWLFLFLSLQGECRDRIENILLSAIGSVALTSGLALVANLAGVWWSDARQAIWLIPLVLFLSSVWMLTRTWTRTENPWTQLRRWQPDWVVVALLMGSLCVTARYQRPFEPVGDSGSERYLLNADQTYFTALAEELSRGCPPADCPYHAGVRERAYHNLPHLTLALFGRASGESDLLRNHLVVIYSVLVVLSGGLVFCLARELGGSRAAGITGLWLLFVGAIPIQPLWPNLIQSFYCTVWPHSSSTIEPTLLTSPQMFYGITVAYGVLLGLLRVSRSLDDGRPYYRLATLTMLLAALLLRFRVQCFVVLFPFVSAAFLVLSIRHRCYRLLSVFVPAAIMVLLQLCEMKLPAYLPTSQKLRIGNNLVAFQTGFLHDWPGAETIYYMIDNVIHDPVWFAWCWQFVSLSMFVAWNMLGVPMLAALVAYARGAWRQPPDRWILAGMLVFAMASVTASAILAVEYDGYSVGGQILLHLGWFAFPCVAVGVWRILTPLLGWIRLTDRGLKILFSVMTLVAVSWQLFRGPSSCEARVCANKAVLSAGERAAMRFCHDELPADAVLLTNRLEANFAKWSGFAGRRTYLDYPNEVLDPLLPPEESFKSRQDLINQLYQSRNDHEFQRLLSRTSVTHLVEFRDSPLHIRPESVIRPVWHSPDRSVTIWMLNNSRPGMH